MRVSSLSRASQPEIALAALLLLVITGVGRAVAQSPDFECNSHTVSLDRYPKAHAVELPRFDLFGLNVVLQSDFIDAKSHPIRFVIAMKPIDQPLTAARLSVFVETQDRWWELVDDAGNPDQPKSQWYMNNDLSRLLVVTKDFETYWAADELNGQRIRIVQAEPSIPVFLLEFIGLISAGGRGYVDHVAALAIDLRTGIPTAPASIGCAKNDFAGQNHQDEWASCDWDRLASDLLCTTNSGSARRWQLLLIQGKEVAEVKRKPGLYLNCPFVVLKQHHCGAPNGILVRLPPFIIVV